MWPKLIAIAAAGALGAVARYGLSGAAHRFQPHAFPIGTLVVNALGCFLFGLIWAVIGHRLPLASPLRAIVFVGFLGSFTTFSTFAFETHHLFDQSEAGLAVLNIGVQVVLGLLMVWAGIALGRLFA